MKKKILIPIMIIVLVLMVPLFQYATAPKPQAIPFVGMSMVYYAIAGGETEVRTICVLKYNSTTNIVTVRDSQDLFDWMEVDVTTREVMSCTGTMQVPFYVEYWIPTNIDVRSHVNILNHDAVVVGSTEISVSGKTVSAWQLYDHGVTADGRLWQDTWHYEKKTGLLLSAAFIMYDSSGQGLGNWGGHLASTNVVLPGA